MLAAEDRSKLITVLEDEIHWLRSQLSLRTPAFTWLATPPAPSTFTQTQPSAPTAIELYIELIKRCLTRTLYNDDQSMRKLSGVPTPRREGVREEGRDWPSEAETMIGLRRMDNIQDSVTEVLRAGVPGDLIETGVWRGGAVIFMRAILKAYEITDRVVWAADSFAGLPPPDAARYPADVKSRLHQYSALAVNVEEVKSNFARYGLLDEQVQFLVGWFRDTLPSAPIERLAILRLDGDMYESTIDALKSLYPKLSLGGFVIVDDYGAIGACRKAVHDYRDEHHVDEPIQHIDQHGIYWRRRS